VEMREVTKLQLNRSRSLDHLRLEFSGFVWTCPERWTTAERNFRPHDPIGWLGVPMDFMNSAGVLCPSEL
jgi:hypothetical protein